VSSISSLTPTDPYIMYYKWQSMTNMFNEGLFIKCLVMNLE